MPQKPLPLECLLITLRILSQEHDTDTMARLLCVNRTFCAATLPFLYEDCFNSNMHKRTNKSPEQSMLLLIRTLLQQAHPQDRISGLLRAAYSLQDHEFELQPTIEPSVFQYGHFIRKFMPYEGFEKSMFASLRKSVLEYATTHQLYEKYVAEGLFSDIHDTHKNDALECALEMDLNRELMWTLCQEHMETMEELAIPLLDIERYIDHVHQLTSLSWVKFTVPDIWWNWGWMFTKVTQGNWNEFEKERDRLIRASMRFVQQHISNHHNVLQRVKVPEVSAVVTQFEILSLLPPLHNPRSIDVLNLCELAARFSDINLDYVESVDLALSKRTARDEKALQLLSDQPPFLSRCRSLKRLAMETLGPDMFHWAVLEKKQRNAEHQQEGSVGRHLYYQEHGYHNDLVPLRSVRIIHREPLTLVQELNDVVVAFGDILEELTVDWGPEWTCVLRDMDATPQVFHGQYWDLPRLRALSLEVDHFQLHFDLDALQRFHALESLSLMDSINTYNHRDLRSWPSVRLPHLKKLQLMGSPALRFNLDSLHHSPHLEELSLGTLFIDRGHGQYYFFIPSPEDLEREYAEADEPPGTPETVRPSIGKRSWRTWNWCPPMLCTLGLDGVFAFKFDIQLLRQFPNLQHLHLNSSDDNLHQRHITSEDLLRGGQQQHDEDGGQDMLDIYVSLPKLESIQVDGLWIFFDGAMETLCLIVAPNLRSVNLGEDCLGPTLQEWIALSRKMPLIEKVCLIPWMTSNEIKELGLIPKDKLEEEQRNKKRIEYVIDWQTFYDVLES